MLTKKDPRVEFLQIAVAAKKVAWQELLVATAAVVKAKRRFEETSNTVEVAAAALWKE